jgi:hypothetical protein
MEDLEKWKDDSNHDAPGSTWSFGRGLLIAIKIITSRGMEPTVGFGPKGETRNFGRKCLGSTGH